VPSPVFLRWPDTPPGLRDWLVPVAEGVGYLGRPDSPVTLTLVDIPDETLTRLVPDPEGELLLRAPEPNRLNALLRAFAACVCPPLARPVPYSDGPIIHSPWGDLYALRIRHGQLVQAARLADGLRAAVMHHAPDPLPRLLHGHDVEHADADHAAWVALPDVGHTYARGALLGVAMVLPRQADEADRRICTEALGRVTHLGPTPVNRETTREPYPKGLHRRTWARSSRRWASVTPIVLDRFPKPGRLVEHLVADSVARSGYPYPSQVDLPLSPLRGVPVAGHFIGRGPGHRIHACIDFQDRVRGPLLIGRGRYFGLGLLRPEEA
jgi:CRISPR-associated protein Csb2